MFIRTLKHLFKRGRILEFLCYSPVAFIWIIPLFISIIYGMNSLGYYTIVEYGLFGRGNKTHAEMCLTDRIGCVLGNMFISFMIFFLIMAVCGLINVTIVECKRHIKEAYQEAVAESQMEEGKVQ